MNTSGFSLSTPCHECKKAPTTRCHKCGGAFCLKHSQFGEEDDVIWCDNCLMKKQESQIEQNTLVTDRKESEALIDAEIKKIGSAACIANQYRDDDEMYIEINFIHRTCPGCKKEKLILIGHAGNEIQAVHVTAYCMECMQLAIDRQLKHDRDRAIAKLQSEKKILCPYPNE